MNETSKKSISLMVECEDCKEKFTISNESAANEVNHKKEYNVNGKSIFLTYYDCPSCGRRHFVQIDDSVSLGKLIEVNKMFAKLSVSMRSGKEVSKKQSAKFKKARKNLSLYRTNLMKEFTGKTIVDETGVEYTLRFSV